MNKPFRFGVQLRGGSSGHQWREIARKTESLGYSTLYLPDHFGNEWGPLVAMTVAAEATTTLRVGGLVFDNDYRHPVVLAKELATLDLVSEGRVVFGLGAGWLKSDYDQSGMAYDSPGERIDRMVEAIPVFRECFAPTGKVIEGKHYQVRDLQGEPKPHTPGGPPLLIGGGGKRVLSIAAREADIVGVNPNLAAGAVGPEVAQTAVHSIYRERLDWIKEAAAERFDQLELQCLTFTVAITDDKKPMLEMMGSGFGMSPEDADQIPIALIGTIDDICDKLVQRREELGLSYIVVHEPEMEAFAAVVERLAGT